MGNAALPKNLTKQGIDQGALVQLLDNLVTAVNAIAGTSFGLSRTDSAPTAVSVATVLTTLGHTATATEVNRTCDVSGRLVAAGGTLAVTEAAHDGKTILLDTAAGSVCTLPAATGSGARFRFVISVIATSNSHIIKVTGNDVMYGMAIALQDGGDTMVAFETAVDSDTITLNRTTTGSTK